MWLKKIDETLTHKDYDFTKGDINDHSPVNELNNKEYAKASNFYSLLFRQKLQELKNIIDGRAN